MPRLPGAVAAVAVLAALAGYLRAARRLWFYGDDWDFLLNRSLRHHTLDHLFVPHNEHWTTIPILIFQAEHAVIGIGHYVPYAVPVLAAHAGICALLWVLLRRAGAAPWAVTVGVVLMAVCGAGSENLIWDFQITFVGAVFFGLLAIFFADRDALGRVWLPLVWLACCCALMCSGIGVPLVAGVVVFVLLRSGARAALLAGSVPTAAFLAWYFAYGSAALSSDRTSVDTRLQSVKYFWTGLTNVWEVNTGIPNSGAALLVLLVLPVLLAGARDRLGRLALSLICSAAVLFAFTGWTRVQLGLSQATASRYVYVATALTIPAVVWGIDRLARWARARNSGDLVPFGTAVVLVLALTEANLIAAARAEFKGRSKVLHSAENRILAGAALVREHVVVLYPHPDRIHSQPLTTDILAKPSVQAQLPNAQLSAADILAARGRIQVLVGQAPVTSVPVAPTARVGNTVIGGAAATCSTQPVVSGTLVVLDTLGAGARAVFTAPGNRLITSLLAGAEQSPPQSWGVTKGVPAYVATSYGGARLQVKVIGSGSLTVCLE